MKFAAVMLIVSAICFGQSKTPWPQVQSLVREWQIPDVSATGSDTPALEYIRDLNGRPIYKLECHNGNYSDQSEMNFSGKFQCALFALEDGKTESWNLLADRTEQDSDWGNRGRMLSEQLSGACLKWPEYGARRAFLLRGMSVTFLFKDLRWKYIKHERDLAAFTFKVEVQPDSRAHTAEADTVKVASPPRSCMW
jgi:hypothetical protein